MSRPAKRTVPRSGRMNPDTRLNTVVLPAPFGPMSAVIEPSVTPNDAPSTAATPPNDLPRLFSSSNTVHSIPKGRPEGTTAPPRGAASEAVARAWGLIGRPEGPLPRERLRPLGGQRVTQSHERGGSFLQQQFFAVA